MVKHRLLPLRVYVFVFVFLVCISIWSKREPEGTDTGFMLTLNIITKHCL